MKKSIFFRIFSSFSLIIVGLAFLIFVFSFTTIKNHYIETLQNNLKKINISLQSELKSLLSKKNPAIIDTWAKLMGRKLKIRITVIGPDGKVLGDTYKNPLIMENHRNRPEIVGALSKGEGRSVRFSATMQRRMIYVAMPVYLNHRIAAIIRTSIFVSDVDTLLQNLLKKMLVITIALLTLSLLGAYFFSQSISSPIKEVLDASTKIASGNFNIRVSVKSEDEIGELSRSFNIMADKLEELFESLQQREEELRNIISSLKEGLCVINDEGKITLTNKSLTGIIDSTPEEKYWWEVLKDPKLKEFIEKTLTNQSENVEELKIKDRYYIVSSSFLPMKKETIFVFHDITDLKRLEIIKRDFVTNVSHELRTPLTAIKGYLETVEEEVKDEDIKTYIHIVMKHTDRLINIVKDLLVLSQLEEEKEMLSEDKEKIDLKELADHVIKIFKPKAEEKGLYIKLKAEGNTYFAGDPFKLEQLLINLIDNAIKYTEKGGVTIKITGLDDIHIEVSDTGIGIEEKHIPRLFERFYVVNKSHSRKLGGTGLGLSIVKHIVLLYDGKIDVKSKPGKGTTFTITLPRNPTN